MAEEPEAEEDRSPIIAYFQELTGIEDEEKSIEHLRSHQWNLEAAVQDAFNEKEGIRPTFGTTPPPRPPLLVQEQQQGAVMHQQGAVMHPPAAAAAAAAGRAVVRRREGWLQWTLNLAVLPLRFVLSTANEVLQLLVSIVFGTEPTPSLNPRGEVQQFVSEFESQFGRNHPPFLTKSYDEALTQSRMDLQFLLVYLHSPGHQDTPWFCRNVLCSQTFIDFVSHNAMLCLGVSVNTREGVKVSFILRENAYPFLALIVLKQNRLIVCERIEGAVSVDELITRLRTSMTDNEGELVVERSERRRRLEDQQLREAQDQAFQESLAADREKERQREEDLSRVEEEAKKEEELLKQQEREKERFEVEKAICVSRLPPEPEPSDPDAMQVMLRLPTGHRLERCFRNSDKLQSLYDFAYSDESGQLPISFTLITNFPRKELVTDSDGGPILKELNLGKRCALFVHDDTD